MHKPFNPIEFLIEYRKYLISTYGKKWDRTFVPIDDISAYCEYYMFISGRSDGKSYCVLEMIMYLKEHYGYSGGIIRRWDDDLKPKFADETFKNFRGVNDIVYERTKGKYNNQTEEISKGRFNTIIYQNRRYYRAKFEEGKDLVVEDTPLAYTFALNMEEHYKSTAYPDIMITLFDEFMTRKTYLEDESIKYFSVISTIVRLRDNLINFLCANTISLYCPYFAELGVKNVKKMDCGDVDTYSFNDEDGNEVMHLLVHYIKSIDKKYKKSNKYFAFGNPKLKMVTEGKFELAIYPHLKEKFDRVDVKFIYFIDFDDEILQCEIVQKGYNMFTFIHRKTTPIKIEHNTLVFTPNFNQDAIHYRRKITRPIDELGKKILSFYARDLVFYQDNECGNIVENYLEFCK